MLKDERLASDHAPICISLTAPYINMEQLKPRALLVGDHAVLMIKEKSFLSSCKFPELLSFFCDKPLMNDEVDKCVTNLCSTLYECARASKVCTDAARLDTQTRRWERLLESGDDSQVRALPYPKFPTIE